MTAYVRAVHSKANHAFSKDIVESIELIAGHGVSGDAHFGTTVKHRSRVAKDPTQPNLRQVHLIHQELFEELAGKGLRVAPGQMGENITTVGLDLLSLSVGTVLQIGDQATIELTGLRNPCAQIENFMPGLLSAVLDRNANGQLIRKSGVMAIVLKSGLIFPGDVLTVISSPKSQVQLQPV